MTLKSLSLHHPARCVKDLWDSMSLDDSGIILVDATRIFVLIDFRPTIFKMLHLGHCGIQKTLATGVAKIGDQL